MTVSVKNIDRNSISQNARPVVFYDGACPLCSREIAHYRRRQDSDDLLWLDIS